jgi:hypothetical protein
MAFEEARARRALPPPYTDKRHRSFQYRGWHELTCRTSTRSGQGALWLSEFSDGLKARQETRSGTVITQVSTFGLVTTC